MPASAEFASEINNPPRGWTTDYEQMGGAVDWAEDGDLRASAVEAGLAEPIAPCMAELPIKGTFIVLFKSGNTYCISNAIEGGFWRIVAPTGRDEIVNMIADKGLVGLTVKAV